MDEARLKGLMGLCVRAGQGIFGEETCLKSLRNGQAALLLLDEGISDRGAEKLVHQCARAEIPMIRLREGLLEEATGRPGKVMAVRPGGFAEKLSELGMRSQEFREPAAVMPVGQELGTSI